MATAQIGQFANYFGIERKHETFGHIEARNIDMTAGQSDVFNVKVAKLVLSEDITKQAQRGETVTLVEVHSDSQFLIPAKSVIHEFVVVDRTGGQLAAEVSFILGYLSDEVTDENNLARLIQRIAGQDNQVTGELLNQRGAIYIDQHLTATPLATQNEIYEAEAEAAQEPLPQVDYHVVNGNSYVPESKSLLPAITVTSGELHVGDVEFFIRYTPAGSA